MNTVVQNLHSFFQQRNIFNKQKKLLIKYLEMIYYDLIKKENGKGVSKLTFCSYLKFPSLISENLFRIINKSHENIISKEDFVTGLTYFMTIDMEKIQKIIFFIMDFEEKGVVCVQDIKLILRLLDLFRNSDFKYESLEKEFENLFVKSDSFSLTHLTLTHFNSIIKNNENFLRKLIYTLNHGFPITTNSILVLMNDNSLSETKHSTEILDNLSSSFEIFSEKLCDTFRQYSNDNINYELFSKPDFKEKEINNQYDFEGENLETDDEENNNVFLPCLKSTRKLINIGSSYKKNGKDRSKIQYNKMTITESVNLEENNLGYDESNVKLPKYFEKEKFQVDYEGYVYIKNNNLEMNKVWIIIVNKDLFIFNSEKDRLSDIIHISKCYAEIGNIEKEKNEKFFSCILNFKNSTMTLYTISLNESKIWVNQINKATEYRDIYDYYEIDKVIGKGHFSEVRLGLCKLNKTKVAIKVIQKRNLRTEELEATLAEAEILKICNHKNIVHSIDIFDNSDVLYIVLEYLENGTLTKFLKKNRKILINHMIKKIIKEIAEGINYLHKNGIIHRDLKPENIMLNENLEIKIIDLGLSKIVGENTKIEQKLGTITFVAPEVFQGKGYNKEADIWSLGLIVFYLLSGNFAFENSAQAKAFLIEPNIDIDFFIFELNMCNVSQKAIDLVKKCLCEQYKRIRIDKFLQHSWFVSK